RGHRHRHRLPHLRTARRTRQPPGPPPPPRRRRTRAPRRRLAGALSPDGRRTPRHPQGRLRLRPPRPRRPPRPPPPDPRRRPHTTGLLHRRARPPLHRLIHHPPHPRPGRRHARHPARHPHPTPAPRLHLLHLGLHRHTQGCGQQPSRLGQP